MKLNQKLKDYFAEIPNVNQGMYTHHYLEDCNCLACDKIEEISRELTIVENLREVLKKENLGPAVQLGEIRSLFTGVIVIKCPNCESHFEIYEGVYYSLDILRCVKKCGNVYPKNNFKIIKEVCPDE